MQVHRATAAPGHTLISMNSARCALVTGGSSGIGAAFAEQLARQDWDVVLVGRDRERLDATRRRLREGNHEVLVADLTTREGLEVVSSRIQATPRVSLLVNSAGIGLSSPFPGPSLHDEVRMLRLNVEATLHLSFTAARAMPKLGTGAIVNVASTAGVWSGGTYSATKSWVIKFSEGLAQSAKQTGVRCLVVIPGFTRTEFRDRAGLPPLTVQSWLWLDPDRVAREALAALAQGQSICVPSRRYRALVLIARALPTRSRRALVRGLGGGSLWRRSRS